jgi:hypothetical protein
MNRFLSCRRPVGSGLGYLLLLCVCGGNSLALAQDSKPSPEKKPTPQSVRDLEQQQKQLAQRFGKLEELFIRMSELEAAANPTRAGLLMQAAQMSKQLATLQRLSVAGDLLSQGQFTRAIQEQEAGRENLKKLLELLQSENRSGRLRDERARIEEIQKEIRRIEQIQRGQTARTESGQDIQQAASEQKDIKQQLEKVDSDLNDGKPSEESEKSAKPSEPKDSPKSDSGTEKSDANSDKNAMPSDPNKEPNNATKDPKSDSQKEPGEAKNTEPSNQDKSQNKPSSENPAEPKPNDQGGNSNPQTPRDPSKQQSDPNSQQPNSERKDSKTPQDSSKEQNQNDSKESSDEASDSNSESNKNSEPPKPESREERAKKRVQAAKKRMEKAQENLEKKERENAVAEQREAERELREAIDELEKILRQLREEEIERSLVDVESRLRRMLELQKTVREQTEQLANLSEDAKDRTLEIRANKLSIEQSKVVMEGQRALLLLQDEGSSTAFPEALEQVNTDAQTVAKRLTQANVTPSTQAIEDEIIGALEEMLDSLKQVQKNRDEKKKQQQQQQQQQSASDEEEPLVDSISELKLLKTLQLRVNRRTQTLAKQTNNPDDAVGQTADPGLLGELSDLAERQQKIHGVTRDILLKAAKE